MAITESEKQPSSSRKNGCAEVGNMAPSKVTEKYKRMAGDEMKMNIHKNKMLWYNTRYCIKASYERS